MLNFKSAVYIVIIGIIIQCLQSCGSDNQLTTIKAIEHGGAQISDVALIEVLKEEKEIYIDLSYSQSADSALLKVLSKSIDLTIIPNNTLVNIKSRDIRTITPLLPRILMIFHKNEFNSSLKELLDNQQVCYELTGSSDSRFYTSFFNHYDVDTNSFNHTIFDGSKSFDEIKTQLDSADVFMTIGHINNYLIDSLISYNFQLYPIDNLEPGNSLEGFVMKHPQYYPYLIPKFLYNGKPTSPIPTLAVSDVLVCHKDLSESIVFDIVEVISEKRTLLMQRDQNYNLLPYLENEKYRLKFPLHIGSKNYLNREKPSFIERYAEVLALLLSSLVITIGVTNSIRSRNNRNRQQSVKINAS